MNGFPSKVNLLCGIEDGRTVEHTWSCKALVDELPSGLQAFVEKLGGEDGRSTAECRLPPHEPLMSGEEEEFLRNLRTMDDDNCDSTDNGATSDNANKERE